VDSGRIDRLTEAAIHLHLRERILDEMQVLHEAG